MTGPGPAMTPVARLAPLAMAAVGLGLIGLLVDGLLHPDTSGEPWAFSVLGLAPALVLAVSGAALAQDPGRARIRRAATGASLVCLMVLAGVALVRLSDGTVDGGVLIAAAGALILAGALLTVIAGTPEVPAQGAEGPLGRLAGAVAFALAIFAAGVVLTAIVIVVLWAARSLGGASSAIRTPWGAVLLVLAVPAVAFAIAAIGTHRTVGATFQAQAAANRRNSLILLIALVGVVAALAEIIAAALTFNPVPALLAAGIAAVVGLGAAMGADRFGAAVIVHSAGGQPADPQRDGVLLDVCREVAIAAGLPEPAVYVIEDPSQNAFATGRDPAHGVVAATRGLLDHLDREQLQGVIGHEMGHLRNLDTRYALYVAVLVGLVALVTDGFLRIVIETWRQGGFFWHDDDDAKATAAALASGIAVGILLLLVAVLLRVVAPVFAALVQAAVSREREFLADATSVELTRNPTGLERALAEIATDSTGLAGANRGTQHLWFRNPVNEGGDRGPGLLSTHPSIGARIERLRLLRGLSAADAAAPATLEETS